MGRSQDLLTVEIGEDEKERFRDLCPMHGDLTHVTRLLIEMFCEVKEGKLSPEEALIVKLKRWI
jgi:hypothetical protein